jgi:hypothetical protein
MCRVVDIYPARCIHRGARYGLLAKTISQSRSFPIEVNLRAHQQEVSPAPQWCAPRLQLAAVVASSRDSALQKDGLGVAEVALEHL